MYNKRDFRTLSRVSQMYHLKVQGSVEEETEVIRVISHPRLFQHNKTAPTQDYSRHNKPDSHINSERLWKDAQDLHRFKPDKIPTLKRGNEHNVPL